MGLLLSARGVKIQLIKLDPYYNINAGTIRPGDHGEVYLCNDGSETDLDLGTYERITGIEMSTKNITTSGMIMEELSLRQKRGDYLGKTIQVIPHITNLIQEKLLALGEECDVVVVEIGGTVGDMESDAFYHAAHQLKQKLQEDVLICLVAPVIWNDTVKELKTKPLQNAVSTLCAKCLQPDIILCRTDRDLPNSLLDKIANLTSVHRDAIFPAPNVDTIYEVPIEFWRAKLDRLIADRFHLRRAGGKDPFHKYKDLVEAYIDGVNFPTVEIGIVGKYSNCDEAYYSLKEALFHAAVANNLRVEIKWINAEDLEGRQNRTIAKHFENLSGIIVPGGFDVRGVEGKIRAIQYAREKKIPFLGICLGLQCAVIEFCRNVLGITDATSEEFDKSAVNKVIHYLDGQAGLTNVCGTMRLGAYDCELTPDSLVYECYGKVDISERHRHRYEVNNSYQQRMQDKGFSVSGTNPQTGLIEMMELDQKTHPWFIGTQAHPEFRSRFGTPAPLFDGFLKAANNYDPHH
jgi:CTP synthase